MAAAAPVKSVVSAIRLPSTGSSPSGGSNATQPTGVVTSVVDDAARVVVTEGEQIAESAATPERLISTLAAAPAAIANVASVDSARGVVQSIEHPPLLTSVARSASASSMLLGTVANVAAPLIASGEQAVSSVLGSSLSGTLEAGEQQQPTPPSLPTLTSQPPLPRELVDSAEATSSSERAPGATPGAQPPPASGSAAASGPVLEMPSNASVAAPSIAAGGSWQAAGASRHSASASRPVAGTLVASRFAALAEALTSGARSAPPALTSSLLADSAAREAQPTSPAPSALGGGSTAGSAAGGSGLSLALAVVLLVLLAGTWRRLRPGREQWRMPPLQLITARPG